MDFKEQVSDLKIIIATEPRIYLQWINTEKGRDKISCYERLNDVDVRYINIYNPLMIVTKGDKFFKDLEEMYQSALKDEH